MKKNFLLLLLMTLLPLAGWAQTAAWSGGTPEIKYGEALSGLAAQATVVSGAGNHECINMGEGTSAPTGNVNQFRWQIRKDGTAYSSSETLDVGEYTLRLYIRHQSGGGGGGGSYSDSQRDLTFKVVKGEVTVTGLDITKVWDNGVTDPSIAEFGTNASWRSVSGINGTDGEKWDLVKGYLAFQRVDNGTDVGTYKYTFTATGAPTNFDLKFVGGYLNVTQATNLVVDPTKVTIQGWEYGKYDAVANAPANADAFKYGNDQVVYTYAVKGTTDFTDQVPTEAGDYTLKATVPEHLNYAPEVSVTVDFKIEKTDPTITVTSVGSTSTPEFTYNAPDFDETKFEYAYSDDKFDGTPDSYTFTKDGNPAAWDGSAGAWTVAVKFKEGKNWNVATTAPFAFTVGKANNEFTTPPAVTTATLTYDATAKDLLANFATVATKGAGEVQYKVKYTPNEGSAVEGTYAATAPKGTEAGKYEIYRKVLESANYKPIAGDKVGEVTIAKAPVEIYEEPAGKDDLVYNNANQQLLKRGVTVYFKGAKVTPISADYTMGANTWTKWDQPEAKDAGTYTITCQVKFTETAHKNNFIVPDAFDVTATIAKAGLDIAAQSIEVDWTGTAVVLADEHYAKGDPDDFHGESEADQYAIVNSLVKLAWIGKAGNTTIPTDAGYYKFELAPVDTDPTPCNYAINTFSPDGSLQINKVDIVATDYVAPTAADLTYTGEAQNLVATGYKMNNPYGEIQFATSKEGVYSTTVPQGTNANTYEVWYYIKGDNNHNDVAAAQIADTKIKQAELTIDIEAKTKVYGDVDPKLTAEVIGFKGDDDATTIDLTFSRVTGEDVGPYDITATWDATKAANYDVKVINDTDDKLTITKANAAAATVAAAADLTYTGVAQPLVTVEGTATGGTMKYYLAATVDEAAPAAGDAKWQNDVPQATAAGNYAVYYYVAGDANHNDVAAAKVPVTIAQAPLAITIENKAKVYGTATDPELTATYNAFVNSETAATIGLSFEREAGEDVGEYAITAKWDAAKADKKANYAVTVTDGVFTINPKEVTPTEPELNVLTYNGKAQELVKAGEAEGTTITYAVVAENGVAVAEPEYTAAIPTRKDAGTYTVHYKFAENSNYTYSKLEDDVVVKIGQAHVTYRLLTDEREYTGEAYKPIEGQTYELSDGNYYTGDDNVFTFDFPAGFDATTACEEGREFDKLAYTYNTEAENYTVSFENKGLLVITKAALVAGSDFTAPAAEDLTFNGHSRKLVSAGEVSVVDEKPLGTILFSTTENGAYTEAIPEGTNAGVYNVWYMVKGDANHSDTKPAKVADVKIKPYALTADMLKATAADLTKVYNGQVQSFNIPVKVKFAGDKNETVLEEAVDGKKDFTVTINGKARKDIEVKNAGAYEFAFTGTNNYTGTVTTTAYITKMELIATAPNAVKTYDGTAVIEPEEFECTATQLKLYGGLEISGLLADDKIDLGDKTIADIIVPEGSAINVGEYNLKVNLAAIPVQANYTFNAQTFNGKLTINKAEAVKIGFFTWEEPNTEEAFWGTTIVKTKEYSKSYGTADPVFITEKGTNDVTSISGDLMALEGELFEDNAVVATLLGATRTAGEVYTKDGYTVKLGWKNTSNTAELAKIATFKNNYKNVTFGTTKLNITPFEGTIKVSIKSDAVVFDGKEHADAIAWAADLSNMVVVGMPAGKNKNEIFTELPKITVTPKDGKVRNAGDYNITLSGGKSDNYDMKKVQFVLGSYLTVEPFEITPDMVTIPDQQVKIGDKAKDVIKHDAFTFAEGALPVAEDANLFQVVAAPDFIDANGKIKLGADPAEGLILARKDNTNAEALNYIGYDEVFGYLSIIGTPDLLVLDDTKDIATKDRENTDVTFTNRSIRQDDWNVLCLPFDATIKEISDAFGYAAVDLLKKESVDGSMHFVVTTSGTVPAGEPFIIKPTSDPELNAKSNFVQVKFTGVTVKEFSDNPEPVKDSAGNKFCGTFKAQTTFFGEKFWYMSKSEWKQASNFTEANPQKLGAYRAYIETATAGARIFIEEPDGTITAINAIDLNNNTMDEGWYTVNGMKLNAAPTQKGTYIKDGKKVFVK